MGQTYVDKVANYIRGTSDSIVTSREFMQLYNFIIEQCDFGDNSQNLYEYLLEATTLFLRNDIIPRLTSLPAWAVESDYICCFAKAWRDFTLYVKLIERASEYVNRNCIFKLNLKPLTEESFYLFKTEVFWPNKQELLTNVLVCARLVNGQSQQNVALDDLKTCVNLFSDFCINEDPRIKRSPDGSYLWEGKTEMKFYQNYFERKLLDQIS